MAKCSHVYAAANEMVAMNTRTMTSSVKQRRRKREEIDANNN